MIARRSTAPAARVLAGLLTALCTLALLVATTTRVQSTQRTHVHVAKVVTSVAPDQSVSVLRLDQPELATRAPVLDQVGIFSELAPTLPAPASGFTADTPRTRGPPVADA